MTATLTPKQEAAQQAALWLADPDALILDTETTGLDSGAEIVQLAVMDVRGNVLLDALVQPTCPISPAATNIHGITSEAVALAPGLDVFTPVLNQLFQGRTVIIYNASYDARLLVQSLRARGMRQFSRPDDLAGYFGCRFVCAMELYAQWVGDWNSRFKSYRWQKLPGGDHSALGDCRATLAVLKAMAGD